MIKKLFFLCAVLTIISCAPKQELILLETDYGNMKISLFDSTPLHRDNFKKLVKEGFYNDLLFHRVIKDFMIQGGDPDSKGAAANTRLGGGGPPYKIDAEIGGYHFKGRLAAARTGNNVNPQKQSSGSQFYIIHGINMDPARITQMGKQKGITYSTEDMKRYADEGGRPDLDNEYTVFGEVIEGLDVIDKIASVQTAPGDRPVKDVKMKMSIIKK